jgi:hypothetical protein
MFRANFCPYSGRQDWDFYNIWYNVLLMWRAGFLSVVAWHYVYGMKVAVSLPHKSSLQHIQLSFLEAQKLYAIGKWTTQILGERCIQFPIEWHISLPTLYVSCFAYTPFLTKHNSQHSQRAVLVGYRFNRILTPKPSITVMVWRLLLPCWN